MAQAEAKKGQDHFATATLIRVVEERLLSLYGEGRLHGTVHTCIGQEWTGVSVASALRSGDYILSNHRGHGHYLAWTDDVEGLIAEVMGRESGVCRGRGGSQHLRGQGFFSNGIIGGMAPVAAGLAMAHRLAGDGGVAVLFIGDGGLGQGALFEALNLAASFSLPLVVLVEANGIAQSTPVDTVQAGSAVGRARAFGIEARESDTWNPEDLLRAVSATVDTARREGRPLLHLVRTFRLMPHSKGDDTRAPDLIEEYRLKDPVTQWLAEGGPDAARVRAAAVERVEAAVAKAAAAPPGLVPSTSPPCYAKPVNLVPVRACEGRLVEHIRAGLDAAMAADDRLLLLGEDICSPYGGAFKVTSGLSDSYPGRVFNTPISEAGLVGVGAGLALAGRRVVAEIMFGDFLTLVADQLINHAAKFTQMYGEDVEVPLLVRTPMGGRRGYGPTHSQSLETHFFGVPGLTVLAIHHRMDAAAFYARLIATAKTPHLIIENKVAYGVDCARDRLQGFSYVETDDDLPTLVVRPCVQAQVTILGYGGMLLEMEKAMDRLFEDADIVTEAICPVALYPSNMQALLDSVSLTRRLVVVEEGQGYAGYGAEAVAFLHQHLPGGFSLRRLSALPTAIPCSREGEAACLVSAKDIVEAVQEILS
ncbi:Pyruvate/2-oxoglutarate dehydrogenase complex [Paramagnetospirillum magneticum AMB-1]|uniref:2-oxoglutarate dehydrogenase E1 component n=2 Tax=Paramagnetospirillum magneticum TaxID=84159 RepID=Q2WB98_PARM1|nr:Pyruvate/2-oxoglutarate dehydrogenase complex [Paramagnetospirillum magneticum AMB-1]